MKAIYPIGLKSKITIVVSILVIFLISSLAYVTLTFFETQLKATIAQNQFVMVSGFASEIDKTFVSAQNQLLAASLKIPPDALRNPVRAQTFVDSMIGLTQIFDNQISILTPEGKILAEMPFHPDRRGSDVSYRSYFKDTVATKAAVISDPYVSSLAKNHPVIMMTAPVFDNQGSLVGIMLGAMDLLGRNTLLDLSKVAIGHSGYLYLTTRDSRTMVMHPDTNRILKPVLPGSNFMYDKAVGGFEGTGETVNTYGIDMLVSFKHLKINGWILAANYPVSEAHSIIFDLEKRYFITATFGIICILLAIYLLIRYLTSPLIVFTKHVEALTGTMGTSKLLEIKTHDEIGTLSRAFNRMLSELDKKKVALETSESRYRTIYDSANDAIFIQDIGTGAILDVNRKMCEMYGFSREEAQQVDVGELSAGEPPYTMQDAFRWISKAAQGEPQLFDWKAKDRYGRLFWVEVKMRKVEIDGTDRLLVTVSDITARKRAEKDLSESEERFSKAFKSSPAPMVITDMDSGLLLGANERWLKMTGYNPHEVSGRTTFELRLWQDVVIREDLVAQLRSKGTVKDFPCQIMTKSADILDVFWSAEIINLGGKKVALSLVYDNTEKNIAKREQEKLQAQLLQSQKMESVGRLAGGVAHDYNNMLGVIIGHAELAMAKINEDNILMNHLREIMNAAQRSAELTRQLLAFARRQTIAPKILDLNILVATTLKMLEVLIGENIELFWLPGNGVYTVKIDPIQFNQLLMNLCINARDAIAEKGRISIETQRIFADATYCNKKAYFMSREYIVLILSDNGCGMDRETQSKIFEPFFTTKSSRKGTGLGLSTVYGIVKQNHGFINVYSELGAGTTFKIYLPYHNKSAVQLRDEEPQSIPQSTNETVLVVEDESALLDISTRMLADLGYKVLSTNRPTEAILLSQAHAGSIDLLLTDVMMPEMNGRELEQNILKSNPKIKTLFTSGYTANVITHQSELDADVHFIQKPFTLRDLAIKIRESFSE